MHILDDHRPWPRPKRPWILSMVWAELLFAHWSLDPEDLAMLLPPGIELDTFKGRAWISVVPFLMRDTRPRFFPSIPFLSNFPELNLRTYVKRDGRAGVWFFSLDATNPVAVRIARRAFSLPYLDCRTQFSKDSKGLISYKTERTDRSLPSAHFDAAYRSIGDPVEVERGGLVEWLTERYCFYARHLSGAILRSEIHHTRWPLERVEAKLNADDLFAHLGRCRDQLVGRPPELLQYSKKLEVMGWWPELLVGESSST